MDAVWTLVTAPFPLFLIFLIVVGISIDVWDRFFRKG